MQDSLLDAGKFEQSLSSRSINGFNEVLVVFNHDFCFAVA
jgi:hypothetical protein